MKNYRFLWLRNRTTDNRKCEKARNIKEKRTIEMLSAGLWRLLYPLCAERIHCSAGNPLTGHTERSFHAGAALFYLMNAADRTIILLRVIISTQVFVIMTAKGGMTHGKDSVSGR